MGASVDFCLGDIFLLDERDIIHTNLSVREGLGESCAVGL